jgi:hypothetical protein
MSNFYGGNTCKRGHDLTVVGVNDRGKCSTCSNTHKEKLSFKDAEHIRALYALTPMSQKEIAKEYGVAKESISQICLYKVYVPEHMKSEKSTAMCRSGLHDMDAPNGRTVDGTCRECVNARVRRQRKEKPEKYGRYSTKYNRKMKGMKGADLDARKVGNCDICNAFRDPLHMDHCHKTGYVRGWLCAVCNTRLGILELTEWVETAQEYLRYHSDLISKKEQEDGTQND